MAVGTDADHYGALGVAPKAPPEEVKRAYRALSRQYHPDKAAPHVAEAERRERERRMVALNVAYQVLSSPRQRREYDLSMELQPPPRSSVPRRSPATEPSPAASQGASFGVGPTQPYSCQRSTGFAAMSGARPPRYQSGGKYTQRSRQARRMDPSQYTTHIDGRAAEFPAPFRGAPCAGTAPAACVGVAEPPGAPKNPMWLQRQLDIAREWEEAHCPEPEEKKYQWRKASDTWLRNRERRRADPEAQDPVEEEADSAPSTAAAVY